jgi:hypothetical protein
MSKRKLTAAVTARIEMIRRRHLKALATMRHGNPTIRSRALLTALLACGMTGPEVQRYAPWLAPDDLQRMIDDIDAVPKQHWTAQRLGALVKLTDEERERGRLWSLRPCGIEWSVIQERVKERKRARDRARNGKRREMAKMAKDLDVREEALFVTIGINWMLVSDLVAKVASGRAWCGISEPSLSVLVRRNLDRLVARGLIESQKEPGFKGLPTRSVRKVPVNSGSDLEATHFCPREQREREQSPPDRMRKTRANRALLRPRKKSLPSPKKESPADLNREATRS